MNQENNNEEQQQPQENFLDRLSQRDILGLTLDIVPSVLYVSAILAALNVTPQFCDAGIPIIFRALAIIYTCFVLKGIFQLLLVKYNKANTLTSKISLYTVEILSYLCYFISVFLSYDIFSNKPSTCFISNTFSVCVLFVLVFLGIVNIGRILLNGVMVLIFFPLMILSFFDNPREFYSHFGMDPEIVRTLPTVKADSTHCVNCVICAEDIKEGDDIIILRCPGHHCFHGTCIKNWLRFKVMCPMCRSENIL